MYTLDVYTTNGKFASVETFIFLQSAYQLYTFEV